MRADQPYLYHVTTREAAERMRDDGYRMRDWGEAFDDWGLSLEFQTDAWDVPEETHHTLVGVALAEHILEVERLPGHPSRTQAGFFYANPWTAREMMRTGSFGNTCVVVDAEELDGTISYGRMSDVGKVFSFCIDASEYEREPLTSVDELREMAGTYWLRTFEWAGNPHPRAEVFVPAETGVPSNAVKTVIDDPSVLAEYGRSEGFERYTDDPYAEMSPDDV